MQLSPHFESNEFEHGVPIPPDCMPIFTRLCQEILEPARSFAGEPLIITSGYRSPETNSQAHGQPNSEHIATPQWCAADFSVTHPRAVFDYLRMTSSVPYHQLILEASSHGTSIIHVSINEMKIGVRSVLTGSTHNAAPYISVDHVAFEPSQQENA